MSQARPTKAEVDKYAGHYVLYGDQTKAFREVFPNSKAKPETLHQQASKLHALPNVHTRIEELKESVREVAKEDFKIDAAWVLKQAVEVHNRCMASSKVYDRSGEPIKDEDGNPVYTFQHVGANKSLEIIGKHIDVAAFSENINIKESAELSPWASIKAGVDKLVAKDDDE